MSYRNPINLARELANEAFTAAVKNRMDFSSQEESTAVYLVSLIGECNARGAYREVAVVEFLALVRARAVAPMEAAEAGRA